MSNRPEQVARSRAWFVDAFQGEYLALYAHRDAREAERLVTSLRRAGHLNGRVLDLCCGGGRLLSALPLESEAVGVDLSLPLLRAARSQAPARATIRGDMRRLPLAHASFDLAVSFFTSFGYFDTREEDALVLAEVRRVLRPGGRFVLDFLNAAFVRASLAPEGTRRLGEVEVHERRWIDEDGPFVRKRVTPANAEGPVIEERVRLYTPEELRTMLEVEGFRLHELWGDYDAREFDPAVAPRAITIATKEGE